MIYTQAEQTEKKYKVSQAVAAAKTTLLERNNVRNVCIVDVLKESGKDLETPITLVELNDLSYQIVHRSLTKFSESKRLHP